MRVRAPLMRVRALLIRERLFIREGYRGNLGGGGGVVQGKVTLPVRTLLWMGYGPIIFRTWAKHFLGHGLIIF